ncbi:MAG: YccF domain-containing protein, partial [Candidatus Heimdallarchaeota archaeon]|nr:YccF domain-containing protein [Candidatus Heimdallarchaeota archaeon]MCK4955720.1 YccF domain-containing protein [Candidatus Heimdallarchaeota archaeon]
MTSRVILVNFIRWLWFMLIGWWLTIIVFLFGYALMVLLIGWNFGLKIWGILGTVYNLSAFIDPKSSYSIGTTRSVVKYRRKYIGNQTQRTWPGDTVNSRFGGSPDFTLTVNRYLGLVFFSVPVFYIMYSLFIAGGILGNLFRPSSIATSLLETIFQMRNTKFTKVLETMSVQRSGGDIKTTDITLEKRPSIKSLE